MQLKYGEAAKEAGVFIVGSCGWDSIPIETGLIFARKKFEGSHSIQFEIFANN